MKIKFESYRHSTEHCMFCNQPVMNGVRVGKEEYHVRYHWKYICQECINNMTRALWGHGQVIKIDTCCDIALRESQCGEAYD